jgi:hypothetical protein
MTKIITCSELRHRTLAELEALFRTLQIELGRMAPGSRERAVVLASLEGVRAPWRRAPAGIRSRERGRFGPRWKPRAYGPRLPALVF